MFLYIRNAEGEADAPWHVLAPRPALQLCTDVSVPAGINSDDINDITRPSTLEPVLKMILCVHLIISSVIDLTYFCACSYIIDLELVSPLCMQIPCFLICGCQVIPTCIYTCYLIAFLDLNPSTHIIPRGT